MMKDKKNKTRQTFWVKLETRIIMKQMNNLKRKQNKFALLEA